MVTNTVDLRLRVIRRPRISPELRVAAKETRQNRVTGGTSNLLTITIIKS